MPPRCAGCWATGSETLVEIGFLDPAAPQKLMAAAEPATPPTTSTGTTRRSRSSPAGTARAPGLVRLAAGGLRSRRRLRHAGHINHLLSGRASRGIADRLRRHGYRLVAEPESFLVNKSNQLLPSELERATAWGAGLLAAVHPA